MSDRLHNQKAPVRVELHIQRELDQVKLQLALVDWFHYIPMSIEALEALVEVDTQFDLQMNIINCLDVLEIP